MISLYVHNDTKSRQERPYSGSSNPFHTNSTVQGTDQAVPGIGQVVTEGQNRVPQTWLRKRVLVAIIAMPVIKTNTIEEQLEECGKA